MPDVFQYQRASALKNRKPVEWLIPNIAAKASVTTMFALPGQAKSFLALHFALKVATERGPTLFVAGEGESDLGPRIEAWLKVHRSTYADLEKMGGGFFFLADAINLFDDSNVTAWIASLAASPPVLIVLDALADCLGGADEDRAKDMNRVFANVWRVVRATGAGVLIVHHAGWNTGREKGSIATRAKSDVVAGVTLEEKKGRHFVKVECFKSRKARQFKPIHMELKEAITADGPVLAVTGAVGLLDMPVSDGREEIQREKAISIFRSQFAATGATAATWTKAIIQSEGTAKGWSRWTCSRLFNRLRSDGKVRGGGDKGELFLLGASDGAGDGACAPPKGVLCTIICTVQT